MFLLHYLIPLMTMPMMSPTHTPLPQRILPRHPVHAVLPQQRRRPLHVQPQHLLDIPRQFGVIPVARHRGLEVSVLVACTVPVQRDVGCRMSARRPVDAGEVGLHFGQRGEDVLFVAESQQFLELGVSDIRQPEARHRGVDEEVAHRHGPVQLVLPQHLVVLEGMLDVREGQRVEAVQREPAALVIRGRHHHRVRVRVDPFLHVVHDRVVHDGLVQVRGGVVGVACVVDARRFDHDEVACVGLGHGFLEGRERGLRHFQQRRLFLGRQTTVDFVLHLVVVEQPDVGESGVGRVAELEFVEGGAVLHHAEPLFFRESEQVEVVGPAGFRVGLRLEVASATAQENVDHGTERVGVADLLSGNGFV